MKYLRHLIEQMACSLHRISTEQVTICCNCRFDSNLKEYFTTCNIVSDRSIGNPVRQDVRKILQSVRRGGANPVRAKLKSCWTMVKIDSQEADRGSMARSREIKKSTRCAYHPACYLASELKCFGYKLDCVLYRKTNGEQLGVSQFDRAMDELIDKTRKKFLVKSK